MKVCRVRPDDNACYCCIDEQIDAGIIKNCKDCPEDPYEYQILQLGVTLLGKPYVLVLYDGKIKKVHIDRLYNVREAVELCSENTEK